MVYRPRPEPQLSKTEQVYESLHRRIVAGELPEGTQLRFGDLAAEMGISHVPVREAVRRLEAQGFVELVRNKGARVRSIGTREYAMTLETLAVLEGAAVAQNYLRLAAAEIKAAQRANEAMGHALGVGDQATFLEANLAFHRILISGCANTVLTETIGSMNERLTMIRNLDAPFDEPRAERSVLEHRDILAKIERRAAASTIEKAVRLHRLNTVPADPAPEGFAF